MSSFDTDNDSKDSNLYDKLNPFDAGTNDSCGKL